MKKGFTVVELIASFTLAIIIAVLMFQVVLIIKGIFTNSGLKTQLLNKQALISDNIYRKKSASLTNSLRDKSFLLRVARVLLEKAAVKGESNEACDPVGHGEGQPEPIQSKA